jgi:hypothetical protein
MKRQGTLAERQALRRLGLAIGGNGTNIPEAADEIARLPGVLWDREYRCWLAPAQVLPVIRTIANRWLDFMARNGRRTTGPIEGPQALKRQWWKA